MTAKQLLEKVVHIVIVLTLVSQMENEVISNVSQDTYQNCWDVVEMGWWQGKQILVCVSLVLVDSG